MDKCYLGIDSSNYTSSVCILNATQNEFISKRKLLSVKPGELGLRQSEAVFQHVKNFPELIDDAFLDFVGEIRAYGASSSPTTKKFSYMPCFKVGTSLASAMATSSKLPYYQFSHQQGHIASALYSINKLEMMKYRFIAFHVSGGTTDALVCNGEKSLLNIKLIGTSLDLHAGQLIDRVGVKLGLSFPCGKELEKLALLCDDEIHTNPCIKGNDCCLSGFENIVQKLIDDGYPKEYIAKYTLIAIAESLFMMLTPINREYGRLPIVFSGGVMSNSIIKNYFNKWVYNKLWFSDPEFATDNALGIAVLTSLEDLKNGHTKSFNCNTN